MFLNSSKYTAAALCCALAAGCAENTDDDSVSTPSNTAPKIVLEGSSVITIDINQAYIEPGFIAFDEEDGVLTSEVEYNINSVNTSLPGTYQVVYQVTDSGNLSAPIAMRVVHVVESAPSNPGSSSSSSSSSSSGSAPAEPVDYADLPAITTFEVVALTDALDMLPVHVLNQDLSLNIAGMPTSKINIIANSEDVNATGSVHFKLTGPMELDRYENYAVYTVAVQGEDLDLTLDHLPIGDYKLIATPYELKDMGGKFGRPTEINFSVVNRPDLVSDEVKPSIAAIELMATADQGELISVERITEGSVLNMNQMPSAEINFAAIPFTANNVGSIEFSLRKVGSDSAIVEYVDSTPAFTAADEGANFDVKSLSSGMYRLEAVPYSDKNRLGVLGKPFVLEFEIDEFVAPTIFAENDEYSIVEGTVLEPIESQSVTANDTFDPNSAIYSVSQEPSNGAVSMDITGLFFYEPNPGFYGTDQFTYEIRQEDQVVSASVYIVVEDVVDDTPTDPIMGGTSGGFTKVVAQSDTKKIYVSSSGGNDRNDCLSTAQPCKSLNAALDKMRKGYPDHVYLKRGDVWTDEVLSAVQSGRNADQPAVVTFYGDTGPRPELRGSRSLLQPRECVQNINFIGLNFNAYRKVPGAANFNGDSSADIILLKDCANVLFEDNVFNYLEVIVQAFEGKSPRNFVFRRNIWTGAWHPDTSFTQSKRPSNLYVAGIDGLVIEENVFDYGGWNPNVPGAGANQYNHNLYLQYDSNGNRTRLENNIITRGSSHGAQLRSGGIAKDNFFGRNTIGLMMGTSTSNTSEQLKVHTIGNVVSENMPMNKGIEACDNQSLCTSAVWGIEIKTDKPDADYIYTGNVIQTPILDQGWETTFDRLVIYSLRTESTSMLNATSDNVNWGWPDSPKATLTHSSPGRNLADYSLSIGGEKSFDAFMNVVRTRPLQTWDPKYTAKEINRFIKSGY